MVNRLIKLTVETGCACAISAVLELGFFLGIPSTNIHLIVWVSLKHRIGHALTKLSPSAPSY